MNKKRLQTSFFTITTMLILFVGCKMVENKKVKVVNENQLAGTTVDECFQDESVIDDEILSYRTYALDEELLDERVIFDKRLINNLVNAIVKHFKAMDAGDIEAFESTLTADDPSDLYSEPRGEMRIFEKYINTSVYVR